MNTDIQDLFKNVKIKDIRIVGTVASFVIVLVLTMLIVPMFIRSVQRNQELAFELDAAEQSIAAIEAVQDAQPASLRQRLAQARAQLALLLVDFPSTSAVAQELSAYYGYANELDAQLVRMEAMVNSPEEDAATAFKVQRFMLEVHGQPSSIMRFWGQIASGPFETFYLDNLVITPGAAAVGQADLTVYASDLALGLEPDMPAPQPQATTIPVATPTLTDEATSEVLRLETLMQAALVTQDWAAYVGYGQRILELDPARQNVLPLLYQAHVAWAQQLSAQGDTPAALGHYEEARRLVPNGPEALEGLRALGGEPPAPAPTLASTPVTVAPSPSPLSNSVSYRVRPGDTLSAIAARYGVSLQELMDANRLYTTTIYIDQRLVIPVR